MVMNDVCSYIIHTPADMEENDELLVEIDKIENANVYVSKGKGYRWVNHLDRLASNGNIFSTRMGWQIYVVGVGNSMFKGTFRMKIYISKGTAESVIIPEVPVE